MELRASPDVAAIFGLPAPLPPAPRPLQPHTFSSNIPSPDTLPTKPSYPQDIYEAQGRSTNGSFAKENHAAAPPPPTSHDHMQNEESPKRPVSRRLKCLTSLSADGRVLLTTLAPPPTPTPPCFPASSCDDHYESRTHLLKGHQYQGAEEEEDVTPLMTPRGPTVTFAEDQGPTHPAAGAWASEGEEGVGSARTHSRGVWGRTGQEGGEEVGERSGAWGELLSPGASPDRYTAGPRGLSAFGEGEGEEEGYCAPVEASGAEVRHRPWSDGPNRVDASTCSANELNGGVYFLS